MSPSKPQLYSYTILNEFPHDKTAYTQGLEFYRDTLYESTGLRGKSSLRKVDFESGEIYNQVALDKVYFGEGITILKDKLYQLTWQGNIGFQYRPDQLKIERTFAYQESKEGWDYVMTVKGYTSPMDRIKFGFWILKHKKKLAKSR